MKLVKWRVHSTVALLISAIMVTGCLNSTGANKTGGSGSKTAVSGTSSTSATETQCLIFQNNARDFSICLGCKTSLCPCTKFSTDPTRPGLCLETSLTSCTVDTTRLVQCVHDNALAAGGSGSCTGLRCGDNQIADFTACVCKDATPPTSSGPAPGQEDTLTPYLQPGFFVQNRFCAPPNASMVSQGNVKKRSCLAADSGIALAAAKNRPINSTIPPVNVFQDVGYLRWDLALDASQYPPALPLDNGLAFMGSSASIFGSFSAFFSLKPNTVINSSTIKWIDCVEHFSGFTQSGNSVVSTNNSCFERAAASATIISPVARSIAISTAQSAGTASVENVSLNGTPANSNFLTINTTDSLKVSVNTDTNTGNSTNFGLKKVNDAIGTSQSSLLSNIGYYKYTLGPFRVARTSGGTDVASGTVTGRISINSNLGFTPVGAVESTAMAPEATSGTVTTRDCTVTTNPHPCVVTSVYRTAGGAVLSQNYAPRLGNGNHEASAIDALPGGVIAVSTPKLIEDVSQDLLTDKTPARLRVFVRGDDGNIYMNRTQNGRWQSWMSLGRPWLCDPAAANCNQSYLNGTLPAVYGPLAPGDVVRATDYLSNAGAIDNFNDGISIASEPVVVSAMKTQATSKDGIIAIFVRVSHVRSSDGSHGTYHNSIFFTMSVATGTVTAGQTRAFDNPRNWTRWMPVVEAGAAAGTGMLTAQGNPTAFIDTANGSGHQIYVIGHNIGTASQPPLAPGTTFQVAGNRYNDSSVFTAGWFGYQGSIRITSTNFDVSTLNTTSWSYALPATAQAFGWRTRTGSIQPNLSNDSIISDLTVVKVFNAATLAASTRFRIFGNQVIEHNCNSDPPNGDENIANTVSPCRYKRQLFAVEMSFNNAVAGGVNTECIYNFDNSETDLSTVAFFQTVNNGFIGTPWAINLSEFPIAGSTLNPGLVDPLLGRKMVVFSRALCPNKAKCDTVNPTLAYMVMDPTAEAVCTLGARLDSGDTNFFTYYGGMHLIQGVNATAGNQFKVQPFPATSDVVPIISNARAAAGANAPFYFFTRNTSGNISHGFFDSFDPSVTSNTGSLQMQAFPSGGFSN